MTSAQIQALKPVAYLHATNFRTALDRVDGFAKRFQEGLSTGARFAELGISTNGAWYASGPGVLTSYEIIGYHADSAAFWAGVLKSRCRLAVYRDGVKSIIRE